MYYTRENIIVNIFVAAVADYMGFCVKIVQQDNQCECYILYYIFKLLKFIRSKDKIHQV